MSRRKCCCAGNCAFFTDDFCDAASTTLSSDWEEVTGDWEYDGSCGLETSDLGAAVLTTATTSTTDQHVGGTTNSIAVGDKLRVIGNAVDANNYLFVEVEQGASDYTIRLFKRIGGTNTLLIEDTFTPQLSVSEETPLSIEICLSRKLFVGTVTNLGVTSAEGVMMYSCGPPIIGGGTRAGLGNGAASTVTWSGFSLGDLVGSGPGAVADQCRENQCCEMPCTCCDGPVETCIPARLLMTITATGGCDSLDGTSIYLDYNAATHDWRSANEAIACFTNTRFVLTCLLNACLPSPPPPIGKFGLYMLDNLAGDCKEELCVGYGEWETSYTCDPFEAIFPAVSYTPYEGLTCDCCDPEEGGSISMTVTEA